jgi:hypothetical protein
MTAYTPEPVPLSVENLALQEYLYREFLRVSNALEIADAVVLPNTNVAPTRPQEGEVKYADGVNWNPGSGEGFYGYINGTWVKMSLGASDDPTFDNVTITGTLSVTGISTFSGNILLTNANPQLQYTETDAAADNQKWNAGSASGNFRLQALTDAGAGGGNVFEVLRSSNNVIGFRVGSTTDPVLDYSTTNGLTVGNDASGATAISVIAIGTYTPTITNTTNVDATTAIISQYIRFGSRVIVFGSVAIDPTAAANTNTVIGISLPIASNFVATSDLHGVAATPSVQRSARIFADVANDRAQMQFASELTVNHGWSFSFSYEII